MRRDQSGSSDGILLRYGADGRLDGYRVVGNDGYAGITGVAATPSFLLAVGRAQGSVYLDSGTVPGIGAMDGFVLATPK
jgi:hypothetical protein